MNALKHPQVEKLMQDRDEAFYLYDEAVIDRQAEALKANFGPFEFLYSIKTNPFPPIVRHIFTRGFGADAASAAEVEKSQALGARKEDIFFSAPGKTRADIEKTLGHCTLIADSYGELKLLDDIAKEKGVKADVGVRVNPDFSMLGEKGTTSKFGIDEETLAEHLDFLSGLTNLTVTGIHVHLRSQVLDEDMLYRYYQKIMDLALSCKSDLGWEIRFINFGGGLGVTYSAETDQPLDLPELGGRCVALLEQYKELLGARFIIETGRFMVCHAGQYVTPIVDIKTSRGVKYLIVKNGINGFLRPAVAALLLSCCGEAAEGFSAEPLFTVKDPFQVSLLGKGEGETETVSVVGNLCTGTDVIANDVALPRAQVGDRVVITNAGSYSYSLSPLLFSSHPLPLQVYVDQSGAITLE